MSRDIAFVLILWFTSKPKMFIASTLAETISMVLCDFECGKDPTVEMRMLNLTEPFRSFEIRTSFNFKYSKII